MKNSTLFKTLFTVTACWLGSALSPLQAGTVSDSLKGALFSLERNDLQAYDESNLDKAKLIAIYFSAHWCPPCRAFTPDLVQFYNRVKKNHPEFELVFCSSDKSQSAMVGYMKEARMPWPVIDYEKRFVLKKYGGNGIPNLVVLDADGKVVMSSYVGGEYVGPQKVLADLDRKFSQERAANKAKGTDFNEFFKKRVGE